MKTVGIIGGIAPESTIAYYRAVIELYTSREPNGSYPSIIINSIDLRKLLSLVAAMELDRVTEYMVNELQKLFQAGADFAVLSSNTPHIVFDQICHRSPLPLISIVEETSKTAQSLSVKRLALLGTASTMAGSFYPQVFNKGGMTIVQPHAEEQAYIHEKYMTEFVPGVFLPETRKRLLDIIRRMKEQDGIDAVILGGTELPLILSSADARNIGIPFLDTKQIHAEAIVTALLC